MTSTQIQTQNEPTDIPVIVGVSNVKTMIFVDSKIFIPKISLKISTLNNRGIHMSRLIESLTESINKISTASPSNSIEEYAQLVYKDLKKRHPFNYFNLLMETELATYELTPATRIRTIEVHDISYNLVYNNNAPKKTLTVKVMGSTACPHALINNALQRTHNQNSLIELSYTPDNFNDRISFLHLKNICNLSFSSPIYTLLKTEDEQAVINTMFENPCFVEDVTRNIIKTCKSVSLRGIIKILVTNYESIHRHDASSEMELRI